MIQLTEKAALEVKKIIEAQNLPEGTGLRVGVRGGGCSGLSYLLNFETQEYEKDRTFSTNDVRIFVDTKSLLYLSGTTIDYADGINGSGFTFDNPNAAPSCGCGSSCSA